MRTHRESFENAWSARHELTVSSESWGDTFPIEASAFDKDPIPGDPANYGDVNDAEFLSKEVRAADLVGEALEIFDPFI